MINKIKKNKKILIPFIIGVVFALVLIALFIIITKNTNNKTNKPQDRVSIEQKEEVTKTEDVKTEEPVEKEEKDLKELVPEIFIKSNFDVELYGGGILPSSSMNEILNAQISNNKDKIIYTVIDRERQDFLVRERSKCFYCNYNIYLFDIGEKIDIRLKGYYKDNNKLGELDLELFVPLKWSDDDKYVYGYQRTIVPGQGEVDTQVYKLDIETEEITKADEISEINLNTIKNIITKKEADDIRKRHDLVIQSIEISDDENINPKEGYFPAFLIYSDDKTIAVYGELNNEYKIKDYGGVTNWYYNLVYENLSTGEKQIIYETGEDMPNGLSCINIMIPEAISNSKKSVILKWSFVGDCAFGVCPSYDNYYANIDNIQKIEPGSIEQKVLGLEHDFGDSIELEKNGLYLVVDGEGPYYSPDISNQQVILKNINNGIEKVLYKRKSSQYTLEGPDENGQIKIKEYHIREIQLEDEESGDMCSPLYVKDETKEVNTYTININDLK